MFADTVQRNFNFLTMLGFASTCVASWEGILAYVSLLPGYIYAHR